MKRTLLSMAIALAFVGAASAQAGLIPTNVLLPGYGSGQMGYFGDEPNVATGGTLPYSNHPTDNKVTSYPADSNGMATARLGGDPVPVLGARFYHRDWWTGAVGPTAFDYNWLLGQFGQGDYFFPGLHGHFVAWHGTWTDLNGDGFLTHRSMTHGQSVAVNAGGRDCGDQQLRTDDEANGQRVRVAAAGVEQNTTVSYVCHGETEWTGYGSTIKIVGYVTPYVPVESLPSNTLGDEQQRGPDLIFTHVGSSAEGGQWISPNTNWDVVFVDNSILETTVTEIYNDPTVTPDGPRDHVPTAGTSLIDVDLYRSIDPLLEGLYQNNVKSVITGAGFDPAHPENPIVNADDPSDVLDQVTGPVFAPFNPAHVNADAAAYSVGPKVYFHATLQSSNYRAVPATPVTFGTASDGGSGEVSQLGDGNANAPIYAGVYGQLGVWHDLNGDGFIGEPTDSPGCPNDPYDCGATQDPNQYGGMKEDGTQHDEWIGFCRAGQHQGNILVTLTSSTGDWGAGVYYLTDRRSAQAEINQAPVDPYEQDGRIAFNPYDDAVLDAAEAATTSTPPKHLILAGPIELRIVCNDPLGAYASYEHLVFLDSNRGFDVELSTESFDVVFVSAGIEEPETVSFARTYAAWDVI